MKSRNKVLFNKARTYDNNNDVADSINNISEIQTEARIQVPTRFRSREAMMKFPNKDKTIEKFHKNQRFLETKDMHPNVSLNFISETPVLAANNQNNESTRIDAENMLQLLSSNKQQKKFEFGEQELDTTNDNNLGAKHVETQYSPPLINKARSLREEAKYTKIPVELLDISELSEKKIDSKVELSNNNQLHVLNQSNELETVNVGV